MKSPVFKSLAYVACLLILTGCTKDISLPSLKEPHNYSGSSLNLYYCGEKMPAKLISYIPSEGKEDTGELTAKGITDLSQLSFIGMNGIGSAPGILPGSPAVSLPVSFHKQDDRYGFYGTGSTDYVSYFEYSGFLEGDSCRMDILNVQLSDKSLAKSVWVPDEIKRDGIGYSSFPFHVVWEIDPIDGLDINLTSLIQNLLSFPCVPVYHNTAYSSVAQLYTNAVQTICFKENGNIIIRYYSSVGGATQLMTSVGNTFQYVLPGSSRLLFYPNPTTVFGRWLVAQSDAGDNPDISFRDGSSSEEDDSKSAMLKQILQVLIPIVLDQSTQGFPFSYRREGNSLSIYLDTAVLLGIVSEIVGNLEKDPALLQSFLGSLASNEEFASLFPLIEKVLPELKKILLNTTRLELGLNLKPYSNG